MKSSSEITLPENRGTTYTLIGILFGDFQRRHEVVDPSNSWWLGYRCVVEAVPYIPIEYRQPRWAHGYKGKRVHILDFKSLQPAAERVASSSRAFLNAASKC